MMGLDGPVRDLAIKGFPIAITIPALQAVRSFYYGTLTSQESTQGIPGIRIRPNRRAYRHSRSRGRLW